MQSLHGGNIFESLYIYVCIYWQGSNFQMDKLTSYIQMEKILASNLSHKWWLIAYYQCLEILMPKHIPCYILFYWHFFRSTEASAQSHQCKFLQISAEITVRSHGDKSSMHALELTADLKPVFFTAKTRDFFTCEWKLFVFFMEKRLSYSRHAFAVYLHGSSC